MVKYLGLVHSTNPHAPETALGRAPAAAPRACSRPAAVRRDRVDGVGNAGGAGGAASSVTRSVMTASVVTPRADAVVSSAEPVWEISNLQRVVLPAGATLTHRPGPGWAFVVAGPVTLETASGHEGLASGDAMLVDARTAYRITAGAQPATLAVADLRASVPTRRLPSPLVVRGFATAHPGVAALVTMCPLQTGCPPDLFAASYGNLIGAAMVASWAASQGHDPAVVGPDPLVAAVVAAVTARPGEEWTVERMARLVHLSRSALTERFRRALGLGPSELVREVRMREARRLLRDASRPVEQVAHAVGYGSTAAFSRAFAAHHGTGPQAWRTRQRSATRSRDVPRNAHRTEDHRRRHGERRADAERGRDPVGVQ